MKQYYTDRDGFIWTPTLNFRWLNKNNVLTLQQAWESENTETYGIYWKSIKVEVETDDF